METFKAYQNVKIITAESTKADGDYILDDVTLRISQGLLSDAVDETGAVLPAIELHDGSHIEHWKNGVLHSESGPAVIDVIDNYEEWWLNGTRVEPQNNDRSSNNE